jgi:hypothetical protein
MTTHTVTTISGVPHIAANDGNYYEVVDALAPLDMPFTSRTLKWAQTHGVPGCDSECFFAVALVKEKPLGILESRVRKNKTYVRFAAEPDCWYKYINPTATREFIQKFDDTGGANILMGQVFALTLLAPTESTQRGYRAGKSGTNKRKPPAQRVVRSYR